MFSSHFCRRLEGRLSSAEFHQVLTAGCRNTVSGNVPVHHDAISHVMWLHEKKMKKNPKKTKTNEYVYLAIFMKSII